MRLEYINPDIPDIKEPEYPGKYYEDIVPATLDFAQRAGLAVNALTETLDPEYDYELYWIIDLIAKEPAMYHTTDSIVQSKFFQALPLVRTASGSKQNLDIEKQQMRVYLSMQGEDGLIYIPLKGRPWALPPEPNPWAGLDFMPEGKYWAPMFIQGRILGAFCIYGIKDPEGPWVEAAHKLVEGIKKVTIVEGDIAYPFLTCTEPGRAVKKPEKRPIGFRAAVNGWLAQGLLQCYRFLGNKDALELGEKMMNYVMRDSGYFGKNGLFKEEFPGAVKNEKICVDRDLIHFHAHTNQIMAALEVVQASGNKKLLGSALKAYEYAISQGSRILGFFPEWLEHRGGSYGIGPSSSEICEVADMIVSAIKLSLLGIDKWDDIDRWSRNQFAECQLTSTDWLKDGHLELVDREKTPLPLAGSNIPEYGTTDRVLERAIGSFSGWPSANDFMQGRGWSIMHCCTGNATRAIYYIWENIISYKEGKLKVNLLLNRASRWADINSHIPYSGRVDIKIKEDLELDVRISEWAEPGDVKVLVNDKAAGFKASGRYIKIGKVNKNDQIIVEFPIYDKTMEIIVEKQKYRIILRGNNVVGISPPGSNWPLYQNGHYRTGQTLWKKIIRFVPEKEMKWS